MATEWKIPTKKTLGVFFVNGWDGIISANIRNPIRSAYNSCRKRNPYKDRRKDRMNGQSRSGQIPSANELPLFVAIRAFPEYWGYLDLSSIFMGFSTIIYIHSFWGIPNFLELPQCSIKSPLNHHEIPLNPILLVKSPIFLLLSRFQPSTSDFQGARWAMALVSGFSKTRRTNRAR